MEYYKNYLAHHGIQGQKWGIRRYQNEDGSLTSEGKARYFNSNGKMSYLQSKRFRKDWNDNAIIAMQKAAKKIDPSRRPESTGKYWDKAYKYMTNEIEKWKNNNPSIFDDAKTKQDLSDLFGHVYTTAALKDFGLNDEELKSALYALSNDKSKTEKYLRS